MQSLQLLAAKCLVVVKKNCAKDDMEMCCYPAFIIVTSFRKTFERMMMMIIIIMCQNLSYLIFSSLILSLCV